MQTLHRNHYPPAKWQQTKHYHLYHCPTRQINNSSLSRQINTTILLQVNHSTAFPRPLVPREAAIAGNKTRVGRVQIRIVGQDPKATDRERSQGDHLTKNRTNSRVITCPTPEVERITSLTVAHKTTTRAVASNLRAIFTGRCILHDGTL
jgi:hypothetical protein